MSASGNIIVVMVENKPGVLNRVTSLLRRRNFNIDSLTVAKTTDNNFSRMTIAMEEKDDAEQIIKQLHKLINVIKVSQYALSDMLMQEFAFIRVTAFRKNRGEILPFAEVFGAQMIHVSENSLTFQCCTTPDKIDEFLEVLAPFGVKECVRSGVVAIAKEKK